jgi:hypothetical protein
MLVMVGDTRSKRMIQMLQRNNMSRMCLAMKPSPWEGEKWGFDNGAFGWWIKGQPFNELVFALRLQQALAVGVPYMAVVPDLVAKGMESLDYSLDWLARLPKKWSWYLALQDGMTENAVTDVLPLFDGLFLGGTDRFKATAWQWSKLAHDKGKKFHYGRAGTLRKLQHAYNCQADSCDSSFPLWSMERMTHFLGFNNDMRKQATLYAEEVAQ